jgi:hypothetical protein
MSMTQYALPLGAGVDEVIGLAEGAEEEKREQDAVEKLAVGGSVRGWWRRACADQPDGWGMNGGSWDLLAVLVVVVVVSVLVVLVLALVQQQLPTHHTMVVHAVVEEVPKWKVGGDGRQLHCWRWMAAAVNRDAGAAALAPSPGAVIIAPACGRER